MNVQITNRYQRVIDEIGNFNWRGLERNELLMACRAYYYFSKQFVDAVHIACDLYPSDQNLIGLREGECDTDNLSPYPGIAEKGEKMNHDEFMRRVVEFASLDQAARGRVDDLGREYLAEVSRMDLLTRAMALSSYEDGGLEAVFGAMLKARDWNEPSLGRVQAFPGRTHQAGLRRRIARSLVPAPRRRRSNPSVVGGVQKSACRRRPPSRRLELRALRVRRA